MLSAPAANQEMQPAMLSSSLRPVSYLEAMYFSSIGIQTNSLSLKAIILFSLLTPPITSISTIMPRGAEYANGAPQSDNPIEVGENKAHGASGQVRPFLQYHSPLLSPPHADL